MTDASSNNFIRQIIDEDLASNKHQGKVATRFPPEPNGYLHIGHAKSICLNFGLAKDYRGSCNLRFDDTNPTTEDPEFVASIQSDIRWLGFEWSNGTLHASGYFEQLYRYALKLIDSGKAFVCSLNEEQIRATRGTVTEAGSNSPYRTRSVEENRDLFERMRAGEFEDGTHVLRAKIDMAAANMKMRDPLLYRIRKAAHYRTGTDWPIYPMYDFAHCLSDSIEGITHSICTLEFENNRELYDWILDALEVSCHPQQIEFARLNLTNTVMSKRKLKQLVQEGDVSGWDDPRMPTLAGYRRRGYTPDSIRSFCERVGVAKANSMVDMGLLEYSIRDDLNSKVPRVLCVLDPLKVVLENYPEDKVENFDAPYYPEDIPLEGSRKLPFSKILYIERNDFMESPPKKFHRLAPGREVRLRYATIIKCEKVIHNKAGEVVELRCTYDPSSSGGHAGDGRKVKGTIHWVSAEHALPVEVRLYDRLFLHERPDAQKDVDFRSFINPQSLQRMPNSLIEPSVRDANAGSRYQFERQGFFVVDPDSSKEKKVFNRIVTLRDSWAKVAQPREATIQKSDSSSQKTKVKTPPAPAPRTPLIPSAQALRDKYGISEDDARVLGNDEDRARFFENAIASYDNPKLIANWILNEVLRESKDGPLSALSFGAEHLAQLVKLIDQGTISGKIAKQVFNEMLQSGKQPEVIVKEQGLSQISAPEELEPIIDNLLAAHPDKGRKVSPRQRQYAGLFCRPDHAEDSGSGQPCLAEQNTQGTTESTLSKPPKRGPLEEPLL